MTRSAISVSFAGKRYDDAWRGLDAFADQMGQNVDDLSGVVAGSMRKFLKKQTAILAKRHGGTRTTATALRQRTGRLVRALRADPTVKDGGSVDRVVGKITLPNRYRIHEFGGTINATEGENLFVPLPAALKADGTLKRRNPRQWKNTFVAKSKAGNLILFRRQGRKIEALYVLKPSITVKPRLGVVKQLHRGFPEFADKTLAALFDGLTKNLTQ